MHVLDLGFFGDDSQHQGKQFLAQNLIYAARFVLCATNLMNRVVDVYLWVDDGTLCDNRQETETLHARFVVVCAQQPANHSHDFTVLGDLDRELER